jgi:hypothetical protein
LKASRIYPEKEDRKVQPKRALMKEPTTAPPYRTKSCWKATEKVQQMVTWRDLPLLAKMGTTKAQK